MFFMYIKRILPLKHIMIVVLAMLISFSVGFNLYSKLKKEVVVNDNGDMLIAKTMCDNVQDAFLQMGIQVENYDYLSQPIESKLYSSKTNNIFIKRAVEVNLHVDGKDTNLMTYRDTVGQLVKDCGIVLGPLDKFEGCSPYDSIYEGMDIIIIRVREEQTFEDFPIDFTIEEKPDNNMNKGQEKVLQEGQNGIQRNTYRNVYEDGKLVSKELIEQKTILNPVKKIVSYGTVLNFINEDGEVVRYKKAMDMRSTAYTASFADTGKHPGDPLFGICYTGLQAREGVIAVDPKVIPLWTKVYVEVIGGPDYGYAIAGDIGSAIKGDLIDLYYDTEQEVGAWGCRNVRVYILNEQNENKWKQR